MDVPGEKLSICSNVHENMRKQFWKCLTAQLDTLVPEYELRFVMTFQCDSGTAKNVKNGLIKFAKNVKKLLTIVIWFGIISELAVRTAGTRELRV